MSDLKKSYLYLFQTGVVTSLTFITIPVIANAVSPVEYGIFALAQVYSMILMGILNLGLVTGYERNYFQYESDKKKAGQLLNSIFLLVLFLSLIACYVVYTFQNQLATIIFNQTSYGKLLILIFSGEVCFSLSQYYLQYLKLKGLALNYIKITIFRSVIYTILVLLFLNHYDLGILSIGYAAFISSLLMFVIVILQQVIRFSLVFNVLILKEVLKLSLPLTPRVFFGFLNTHFDKVMLGALSTMGGVGVYTIGQKVSNVVFVFMTALDHVFIPSVYQKLFSNNENKIANYLLPFYYISIFVALLIVLFIEEVFYLFMPEAYNESINIVLVLCLYFSSMFFGKIIGTLLIFSKKTFVISILTLTSIIINVIFNIPMILKWGAIGAAWATLLAGVINLIISFKIAHKFCSIKWRWDAIIPISLLLFIGVFWVLFTRIYIIDMYEYRLAGKLTLLMCYIGLGTYLGLITKDNLNALRSA